MIEIMNCRAHPNIDNVKLWIPTTHADAWAILRRQLAEKRIDQMYVKLDRPKRIRTTGEKSQNHHLNGHVQQLAQDTGDYFDDMKSNIKRKAMGKGYPFRTNAFGDAVPISESEATTEQCAMLIDTAHEVASFLGVTLREE